MGYNTNFTLRTTPHNQKAEDRLVELSGYAHLFGDECEWYGHENHLKVVAKEFPHTMFALHGEGEESGDVWTIWVMNDVLQKGKASMEIPEPGWVQNSITMVKQVVIESAEKAERAEYLRLREKYGSTKSVGGQA